LPQAALLVEMKPGDLSWAATTIGFIASAFFLGLGMIETVSVSGLGRLYLENPGAAASAYHAASVLMDVVASAALFAMGWWVILTHAVDGGLRANFKARPAGG